MHVSVCTYMCMSLFSSGSGISRQVPILYTRQCHICGCVTIPSSRGGRRCGRGWSQPHSPPVSSCGHHIGGPQKGFFEEESSDGCSDDADGDARDQHG